MSHVIIAGGGIGGLAAAIGLRRLGHQVTVFEAAATADQGGAHIGVQSNAALVLRELGVAETVLDAGVPVRDYVLRSWSGRDLARWSLTEVSAALGMPSVTVPRQTVLDALRSVVADVHAGARVVSAAEDASGVRIRLDDGTTVAGDLLVGADGLHSTVRRSLHGTEPDPEYAGYGSWRGVADTTVAPVSAGTAVHVLGSGRTFGCWPLPGGRAYWVATRLRPRTDRAAAVGPEELAELKAAFAGAAPLVPALMNATNPATMLYTPIFDRPPTPTWHGRRTVLLGDAAHPMQPTTGQGAAQALLDALALTSALRGADPADGEKLTDAFAAYAARRREATAELVKEARSIARMHHTRGVLPLLLRNLVMRATPGRVWQARARARLDELELLQDFRATSAQEAMHAQEGEPSWNDTP